MRNLLLFMLVVGIFVIGKRAFHFSFFGVEGKGPMKTETRSVSNFHAVNLDLSGDVEVRVGDQYAVEVQAQENLLPLLKTEEKDGVLRIYFDKSVSHSENLVVRVTAPSFDALSIGGSGTIKVLTPIKAENLRLDVGGSGDISADQTEAGSITCDISGSGSVQVGGKANNLKAEISGSGEIDAKNMTTNAADLDISGSGSATCGTVLETLKAEVSGSGDVHYGGSPRVESRVSGSGSVEKF